MAFTPKKLLKNVKIGYWLLFLHDSGISATPFWKLFILPVRQFVISLDSLIVWLTFTVSSTLSINFCTESSNFFKSSPNETTFLYMSTPISDILPSTSNSNAPSKVPFCGKSEILTPLS